MSSSQSLSSSLARGWSWWTGEIASLVPGTSIGRRNPPPSIVVATGDEGLRLIDERGRKRAVLSGMDVWDGLLELAREHSTAPVRLRLPYSSCYFRRVDVPAALRADTRRFLDLDLERATPFRLKDVYTAHYIDEARSRRDTLNVCQLVIRRDAVDIPAADIRATGVELSGIDCWSEDGTTALPVNFMPQDALINAHSVAWSRLAKVLAAAVLVLAVSALYLGLSRQERALADLTEQTAAARAKAQAVQQKIEVSESALKEARAIESLRSERLTAVEILDNLTKLLPDSAWLTDLRIEGDRIEFSGDAESAAPLVSAFESSKLFAGAALTSPVTRERGDTKERFSMRVRLREFGDAKTSRTGETAP